MLLNEILSIYFFVLGVCVGSFLNVCISRIPNDESVVKPRSKCPGCNTPIAFYDNIPILSYVLLRGKCRKCHVKISFIYPFVEFLTGVLAYLCFIKLGQPLPALLWFVFFICPLLVISFIDLKHYLIPNILSLPGIVIGFLIHLYSNYSAENFQWSHSLLDSFLGVIVGGGALWLIAFVYEKLRNLEGLGGGDVKLAAMLGAFLGWKAMPILFFYASFSASLIGLSLMVIKKFRMKSMLPFGPFLSLGALLYWFGGPELLFYVMNLLRLRH